MPRQINPNTGWIVGESSDEQGSGGSKSISPSSGWISGPTGSQQRPIRPSQPVGSDTVATPGGGKKKVKG